MQRGKNILYKLKYLHGLFINHPRSGVVYNFGRVCLSVSPSEDDF